MVGNQAIINAQLISHEENPIKESIGDKSVQDIVLVATEEYWKEWKRLLIHSEKPVIVAPGLGKFSLMYGKSKNYLRKMVSKLKWLRIKHTDTIEDETKRAYGLNKHYLQRIATTWKQVDFIKKEVNYKYDLWDKKKIAKYGDKAIL